MICIERMAASTDGFSLSFGPCFRLVNLHKLLSRARRSRRAVSELGELVVMSKLSKAKEAESAGFFFAHHTRYVILVLSTFCLMMAVSNMLALNFTIICMGENGKS